MVHAAGHNFLPRNWSPRITPPFSLRHSVFSTSIFASFIFFFFSPPISTPFHPRKESQCQCRALFPPRWSRHGWILNVSSSLFFFFFPSSPFRKGNYDEKVEEKKDRDAATRSWNAFFQLEESSRNLVRTDAFGNRFFSREQTVGRARVEYAKGRSDFFLIVSLTQRANRKDQRYCLEIPC